MARGGEHLAQDRGDPLRFAVNLLFAQPHDLEAVSTQLEIPASVIHECLTTAVVAIPVSLDHDALPAPEEVDQERADAHVDLGRRKAVSPTDPEKIPLQVAASAVAVDIL